LALFFDAQHLKRKKNFSKSGSKKFSKINIDRFMMLVGNTFEMSACGDDGFTVTLLSRFVILPEKKMVCKFL
jgi:hypothetical protein